MGPPYNTEHPNSQRAARRFFAKRRKRAAVSSFLPFPCSARIARITSQEDGSRSQLGRGRDPPGSTWRCRRGSNARRAARVSARPPRLRRDLRAGGAPPRGRGVSSPIEGLRVDRLPVDVAPAADPPRRPRRLHRRAGRSTSAGAAKAWARRCSRRPSATRAGSAASASTCRPSRARGRAISARFYVGARVRRSRLGAASHGSRQAAPEVKRSMKILSSTTTRQCST